MRRIRRSTVKVSWTNENFVNRLSSMQMDEKKKLLKTPGSLKSIELNCCALVREVDGGEDLDVVVEEFDFM